MVAATSPDVGLKLEEHFNEVIKMSRTGQGGQRKIRDSFLSRRACYLVAEIRQFQKAADPRLP